MLHGHLLRVYDFDGTLFRTPLPPEDWKPAEKHNFWKSEKSLSPPLVPDKPGPEWWIDWVVKSMRDDLKRRECSVVVCTARNDVLRRRVGQLLNDNGLVPNALFLNDTGADTKDHKISKLMQCLRLSRRGIKHIDMWEDNHENVDHYCAFLKAQGVSFTPHYVTA